MPIGRLVPLVLTAALAVPSPAPASGSDAGRAKAHALLSLANASPASAAAGVLREMGIDSDATSVRGTGPVDALRRAVARAEDLRAQAFSGLTPHEVLEGARAVASGDAETGLRLWEQVDRDALASSAMVVLRAIDGVVPALRDMPATAAVASACGVEGDVVLETSDCDVIVGGSDANTYPEGTDPQLLIDLGGDDTYTNGAARAEVGVRVVIDAAGNDTYTQAQRAAAPEDPFPVARGQAAGVIGTAVLADLGGSDAYRLEAEGTAPAGTDAQGARAFGQGGGALGIGVLVDTGGADTFVASARSAGGTTRVVAQGGGDIGIGVLVSLSEQDTAYSATSSAEPRTLTTSPYEESERMHAEVVAQGASFAGAGGLLDAGGDDSVVASSQGRHASATAQGAGELGTGLLIDGAGSDTLGATATGSISARHEPSSTADCWDLEAIAGSLATQVVAQGAASAGSGTLVDGLGDDRRSAAAASHATAVARARSDRTCARNSAIARAEPGGSRAVAHGAAVLGHGTLLDLGGDDDLAVSSSASANATATAVSPGADFESPRTTVGPLVLTGQGASVEGAAFLTDFTGADRYVASATGTETRTSSAGSETNTVTGDQRVHGWASVGPGWITDLGGADVYSSDPPTGSAGNDRCWTNAGHGRGRDVSLPFLPTGCP